MGKTLRGWKKEKPTEVFGLWEPLSKRGNNIPSYVQVSTYNDKYVYFNGHLFCNENFDKLL